MGGLKVGTTSSLHWLHPSVPHSPSSSLASAISSPSSSKTHRRDGALFCHYADRSPFLGANHSSKIYISRSCDNLRRRRRALTAASLASFSDEEFSKQIHELALRFQLSGDEHNNNNDVDMTSFESPDDDDDDDDDSVETLMPFVNAQPAFPERDEINPSNIEMRANRVDIPLSLRIIKRKKQQWQEGFKEAGESACCSVNKAFSSMVFIIRELQSHTLQLREILFYQDLQGILARVQDEMQASFVWLFQQVFSHTPTLMVYVMILLANYSVYSMSTSAAIAATPLVHEYSSTSSEEVPVVQDQSSMKQKFDSSVIKTLNLSSSSGKATSVGGNSGNGGKYRPVASDADGGDGRFDKSNYDQTIVPSGVSSIGSRTSGEESVSRQDEEASLWNSMVDEASSNEVFDKEITQRFISPVDAKIESDDHADYFRTEFLYQTGLAQEPNSSLLLANYAQFLYLVIRDFDRAEDYFKRATKVEPKDAEALNKYANFLWQVRQDLWAAEETYLEAIAVEPDNTYYAANYAHFLWNTGGEDTCFPLSSPDSDFDV